MTNFVRTSYGRPNDLKLVTDKELIPPLLQKLLRLCTPHGTEKHIVDVIRNQPYVKKHKRWTDSKLGNYIVEVGKSKTIFSCHMDIVGQNHKSVLDQDKVEKIFFFTPEETIANSSQFGMIWGAKGIVGDGKEIVKYEPSTLGADDKVGVYILLKLIEAGVPGTYIFHTGEECGGLGSEYLAKNFKEMFEGKDRAIAFDRAGYSDIIGYQRGGRCCSTEFGKAFADNLNMFMPPKVRFKEDAHGTFTDTANYTKLVPECTNVSVGYFNQHGSGEHLDVYWLETWLLPAILQVKYEELPVKRDPKEVLSTTSYTSTYSNNYNTTYQNTPKKEWKDTTVKTAFLEFPLWKPELDIPEGASKEVLIMAMGRFLSNCNYGKDRDTFCSWIIDKLTHIDLLEEENIALQSVLALATGNTLKANPPDVILLPPPAYVEDTPKIKDITPKIELLNRLILVGEKVILPKDEDQKWLKTLASGAKRSLQKLQKKQTNKQIKKVNKLIFEMANLIDQAAVLSADEERVLMAVEQHVCDNPNEDGWFEIMSRHEQTSAVY